MDNTTLYIDATVSKPDKLSEKVCLSSQHDPEFQLVDIKHEMEEVTADEEQGEESTKTTDNVESPKTVEETPGRDVDCPDKINEYLVPLQTLEECSGKFKAVKIKYYDSKGPVTK